jgi:hypothetical protein
MQAQSVPIGAPYAPHNEQHDIFPFTQLNESNPMTPTNDRDSSHPIPHKVPSQKTKKN